jgi:uncharacterized protein YjbI with pentapeptide repeats
MPGANLSNRDLTKAYLAGAFLNNANLSIANFTNADFSTGSIDFFYVNMGLTTNLSGANLSQANLANANFSGVEAYGPEGEFYPYLGANLEGANLSGADTRGANFYLATWYGVNTNNMIWPGGHIAGLGLTNGASLVVRNYDGHPDAAPPAGVWPIVVDGQVTMDTTGKLRLVLDADPWGSTISFAAGISVVLDGTLELDFAPGVSISSQIGRTFDVFDWTGVTPTGTLNVASPFTWNLSSLYTTGEVTLTAAPGVTPGDFNHDGAVDAADYVVWRKGIGVAWTQENYTLWRTHFGQTSGSGAAGYPQGANAAPLSAAVPEPTTFVLLTLAIPFFAERRSRRMLKQQCVKGPAVPSSVFSIAASLTTLLVLGTSTPTDGQTLAGTYTLNASTATPTGWAQSWTAQLAGTYGWTGADGLYSIPMNGNRKLGSAYHTPGWQTFTFNDSLIGTVNEFDERTGFRFINNSIGMYSGTGATPTPISFKWKGDQNPPFDTAESMITGPVTGGLYWPLDGIVVPRVGGGQQFVQFAMKINGGLTPTGVSQMTWPLPDGVNYASNWPYNGNRGDTWNSSIDSVGSLPNLYKSDPDGSGPTGELVMGTAILDISNATTSYAANGYVHIYGTRNDFLSKKVFVARAPPADVSNPSAWSFWNASSSTWVSGASAIGSATPMRDTSNATIGDMAVEYSVTQLPDGRFVMVYLHTDALGTQISARYASAPQGPWSTRQMLYNVSIPNTGNAALGLPDISAFSDWKYVIYGAKAHAQLSEAPSGAGSANAGQMLVSFNVNNWKINGSTSQPDPGWLYGSIYHPRFISVDITGSLPGDFNNDGAVDAADYVVWRKQGGSPAQFATWRANFGQGRMGSAGAADELPGRAVPEPSVVVLLVAVVSLLTPHRILRYCQKD